MNTAAVDTALELETIRHADKFEELAPDWDALVRASPRPSPFLLNAWLNSWWRHFGEGAELLLAPGEDRSVGRAIAARVAAEADLVDLYGLPTRSRVAETLGPSIELVERVEAPVLDLTPGWDAVYRDKTSSKKRN